MRITQNTTAPTSKSILASLRSLTPRCQLNFEDTKALAERQSARLVELLGTQTGGIQETHLAIMPRLRIVHEPLSTSGLSYWNGQAWVIVLNETDSPARQRFTLLHEFKHIVDHDSRHRLYKSDWEAERAADYFAGCVLMPKRDLKRLFCNVTQRLDQLAEYFGVSQTAVRVRLEQTHIVEPEIFARRPRCARPISTPFGHTQKFRPIQLKGSTA